MNIENRDAIKGEFTVLATAVDQNIRVGYKVTAVELFNKTADTVKTFIVANASGELEPLIANLQGKTVNYDSGNGGSEGGTIVTGGVGGEGFTIKAGIVGYNANADASDIVSWRAIR